MDASLVETAPPGEQDPPASTVLEGRLRQAWDLAYASENEAARDICDAVWAAAEAAGLDRVVCRAQALRTVLALRQLDTVSAARHAATAKAIALRVNDPVLVAEARAVAARVCYSVGDNDEGLAEIEAAWPVAEREGDALLRFDCQNTLGIISGNLGQTERSIEWYRQAQDTAQAAGLDRIAAIASANCAGRRLEIGEAAQAEGRLDDARRAWQQTVSECDASLHVAIRAGSRIAEAINLTNRASALAYLGDFDQAMAGFALAEAAAQSAGDPSMVMYMFQPRVSLLQGRGQWEQALAEAHRGVAYGERLRITHALAPLLEVLSTLEEARGNLRGALDAHRRFHAVHEACAADRARQRAQVLAVRLATERALAEAQAARERAHQLACENASLALEARSLSQQALCDALTGLANRRSLEEALSQADRSGTPQPWCVALLDVDHFKRVNDDHSHAVGDRVLAQIGLLLGHHVRAGDLAARYGGEEFVLLMRGAGLQQALRACERLRAAIQAFEWGQVAPGLRITASLGVAEHAAGRESRATLALADTHLYRAKQAGRNRVLGPLAD